MRLNRTGCSFCDSEETRRASVFAKVVFPDPGRSFNSRCPPVRYATISSSS